MLRTGNWDMRVEIDGDKKFLRRSALCVGLICFEIRYACKVGNSSIINTRNERKFMFT